MNYYPTIAIHKETRTRKAFALRPQLYSSYKKDNHTSPTPLNKNKKERINTKACS
jgi:hypothetical protein